METATLLAFLEWTLKNAPAFVNDLRLLINNWASETGADPSVLLRVIEMDQHKKVDAAIDVEVAEAYPEV